VARRWHAVDAGSVWDWATHFKRSERPTGERMGVAVETRWPRIFGDAHRGEAERDGGFGNEESDRWADVWERLTSGARLSATRE
jgi:hypothetical protein